MSEIERAEIQLWHEATLRAQRDLWRTQKRLAMLEAAAATLFAIGMNEFGQYDALAERLLAQTDPVTLSAQPLALLAAALADLHGDAPHE